MSNFNTQHKYNEPMESTTRFNKSIADRRKRSATFLHCQTKEDKIIRNLWFIFVLSVFVFLSVLWYFRGEFFNGELPLNHEFLMAHF
ncbi:MAG: hypothetical protein K2Q34_08950 [Alphaproteobacteria bacterium]|nr:hypothetical protein [Alphaproteobacteria bacterium]